MQLGARLISAFINRIRSRIRPLFLCAVLVELMSARPAFCQFSRFQNYTDEQGLGDLNVTSIAQDSDGYMLFGTQGGLYRYNGQTIAPFDTALGLPSGTWVRRILIDANARTWIATSTDVYLRSSGRFRRVDLGDRAFKANGPHVLAVTSHAVVVVVAGQLRRAPIDGDTVGSFSPLRVRGSASKASWNAPVGFVVADAQDGLLFGCGEALCRLSSDGQATVMGADAGLPADEWQTALRTGDGTLWVRSLTRLAWRRQGAQNFSVTPVPASGNGYILGHAAELELVASPDGSILTQDDNGYLTWNGASWRRHSPHAGGAPDAMIMAFQFDRGGSLWLGSFGHGVFRSQGLGRWEHWTKDDGLMADTVWALARGSGPLWIATDGGTGLTDRSAAPIPRINYVAVFTRRGRLWTAPFGASLTRYDPARKITNYFPSIGVVKGAAVDRDNRLWLSTADAVFMLPDADADPAVARLQRIGSIPGVLDFIADETGATWIASPDGLFLWRSGTGLTRILAADAVTGDPFGGAFTASGDLWLATQTGGILRFARRHDTLTPLAPIVAPEIASNDLLVIHRDRRGWMWVGTDRGIDMFDGRTWRRFTSTEGPITNDLSQEAILEDADGSMWFGTSHGLSHLLDVDHLPPPTVPHVPLITGLVLGIKQFRPAGDVSIPWVAGPLEIRFDDLNYALGQSIRFRYLLKGVDSGWNETDGRVIRYAAVSPGDLTFTLIADDPTHRTSSMPVTIGLHILAPWWQRPFFRVSSALLLLAALIVAWRKRVGVLLRRQAREASYQASVREQHRLEEMVALRTAEIEEAHRVLQRLAMSDALTGLPNRRAIMLALEDAVRDASDTARPLAVLLCDIDHFKSINDHYGHQGGDEVLTAFGERLAAVLADGETAGRYGGEEFLVIVHADRSELAERMEAIRAAVTGAGFSFDGQRRRVTASGGLAMLRPTDTAVTLVARADIALYQAKENGRDRIEWERDETVAFQQAELKRDLHVALVENEFELHFQPVVDLARNAVTSYEALLRWYSPTRGHMQPADFIPFAEQNGLMAEIDAWVLRAACREAAGWPDGVRVSINLSPSHFHQGNLVELIAGVLAETALPATRLELEVTETAMVADVNAAALVLGRLRALGISIALDDFGTGYSSLSFLRTLPFDRIKIDRSFVRDLGEKPEAAAIIGSVIHLCAGMGAAVTAEGVETRRQTELLRAIGCREVQGFYFGRPASAREIRPGTSVADPARELAGLDA